MSVRCVCALLCATALLPLTAEDLPKGTIVDKVVCRATPEQSYALYIPSNYTPDRKWPILYCFDPMARGRVPVELFAEAAERAGVIVAGSNNSRNGAPELPGNAIRAIIPDTHERLAIDDTHVFATGFSGGARVALSWSTQANLAGVIAVGAGFPGEVPKQLGARIYAAAGIEDFNNDDMWDQSRELSRRGTTIRFVEFDGGHAWMPKSLAGEAIDFVLGRVPGAPIPETPEIVKTHDATRRYRKELQEADTFRTALLSRLRKVSQQEADSPDRRAARRVVSEYFSFNSEQARFLMSTKEYSRAAEMYAQALVARPDAAGGWFNLATARAGQRNKGAVIDSLKKAVEYGFKDRARVEREPLFEPFRNDAKFRAVVESIPAAAK